MTLEAPVAHPIDEAIDLDANTDKREEHKDGVWPDLIDLIMDILFIKNIKEIQNSPQAVATHSCLHHLGSLVGTPRSGLAGDRPLITPVLCKKALENRPVHWADFSGLEVAEPNLINEEVDLDANPLKRKRHHERIR
ncbi:MAG: hypothetical protein AB7O44_16150 [Hyphomicrobiaceae bacterium]